MAMCYSARRDNIIQLNTIQHSRQLSIRNITKPVKNTYYALLMIKANKMHYFST